LDGYDKDIIKRYKHGEFFHADSIHFNDSLKYHTLNGRTVYGGGGIMPDYFVRSILLTPANILMSCLQLMLFANLHSTMLRTTNPNLKKMGYESFKEKF